MKEKQINPSIFLRFYSATNLAVNLCIALVFSIWFELKWVILVFLVITILKMIVYFIKIDNLFKNWEGYIKEIAEGENNDRRNNRRKQTKKKEK